MTPPPASTAAIHYAAVATENGQDCAIEDCAIEDCAIEDSAIGDSVIGDSAIEDSAIDEHAIDEQTIDEQTVDEQTVDEGAVVEHSIDGHTKDGHTKDGHTKDGHTKDEHTIDWERALVEHDRWLRSIVYNRVGEPAAVEDVMQEVALAAVRQSAPIKDASKIAPWLYRLAVRQSLLYRRKMGRSRSLTRRYADRKQPTEQDQRGTPLDWLLSTERGEMVRRSLNKIRTSDAEILKLKYQHDWNYHQIAQHLGISHSAVEARLHRARARLRKEILIASNE